MIKFKLLLLLVLCCSGLSAKIKLPAILSDNMVLQQQSIVCLWGKSSPNTEVKVTPSWGKDCFSSFSDGQGNWMLKVETPVAGGPYFITFDDGELFRVNNILIGEIWLCSGQSNMEMPIKGFYGQPVLGSTKVLADVNPEVPIRLFAVEKNISTVVQDDVVGCWKEHSAEAVKEFSAVAYYFGRQLYESLNTPIGLIVTSWGASRIEAWMPEELVKLFPEISLGHLELNTGVNNPQKLACLLHNAMLYPLRNMVVRGVVWYQGEGNRDNPKLYEKLMPVFVNYLRNLFHSSQLPFYYAQIAPFSYGNSLGEEGAALREVQLNCELKIPHSGMAVLMDVGDSLCIHPSQKEIVGERLAFLALAQTYERDFSVYSPRYVSKRRDGDKIILSFEHAEMGLCSFGRKLECFEIAGDDKIFYKALAKIYGNKVHVWSEKVKNPIAVRYAYWNYVKGDLFGINGLPVSSFKTDF